MSLTKTFLAMGIAIIFAVFIAYSLYVLYEPPSSRCSQFQCYQESEKCYQLNSSAETEQCINALSGNEQYQTCLQNQNTCYDAAQNQEYNYSRNSFYILFIIAIAAITGGFFLSKYEGIGSGFIGGGVLIILWSLIYTWVFWLSWSRYAKIIALGIVLALLIYLGYKRVEQKSAVKTPRKKKK